MIKRSLAILLTLAIAIIPAAVFPQTAYAASAPAAFWVAPSETNGIPSRIDLFKSRTGGTKKAPVYTYQLYLPGNADPADCRLSWDGDMQAEVNGKLYTSGECPAPALGSETVYSFRSGDKTVSYAMISYRGSPDVQRVFIEIDESKGTIKAMDSDEAHETSCSGRININGEWYELTKMKGRGNITWKYSEDKKPYNLTLGKKICFPGVSSEPTKKWSFLAEITDHSLLGTRAGFYLAHELGIGQDTVSADVWMNGEYQGCYTVTPKTDSYVVKDGFMIEQDNYPEPPAADGGDPQFKLKGLKEAPGSGSHIYSRITVKKIGDKLLLKDGAVDDSPENLEAVSYSTIKPWLQEAWDAIRSDTGYNSKGRYYTDYIDIVSFAKMYLMQEYIKSYDICSGSILFHRDGMSDQDKLIAGPLWDLDNAMGSTCQNKMLGKADDRKNGDRRSGEGFFIDNITEFKTSIYKTISKHPDFMKEVIHQYNKYRQAFDALPDVTDRLISEIADSARMDHYKVKVLISSGTQHKDNHIYESAATLGSGAYVQSYLATTDSRNDWANYAANLRTYIRTRSLWFGDHYYDPDDPANTLQLVKKNLQLRPACLFSP